MDFVNNVYTVCRNIANLTIPIFIRNLVQVKNESFSDKNQNTTQIILPKEQKGIKYIK